MLKRLEIHGFKSFADKVQIEFNPGLTVIVGPNGSGKSNIADAINWALGEQKTSVLRGARMEEIIFSGSDQRRSVGMCDVSVTLDNSKKIFPLDYSEITITRRIFRSGESQFMINKVPCRLKDIHNLLMDTGIGRGAYGIIGQGKVEEILQSKPHERRQVIEEAAGIVKYRYRKEEALRKLNDTEQDLLRLNDIINELSGRLEQLAEQAEKARRWRKYNDERKELELGLLARELARLEEKLTVLGEQLSKLDTKELQAEQQKAQLLQQLEEEITEKDAVLEKLNEQINELKTQQSKLENDLNLSRERLKNCRQEYHRISGQKKEVAERQQSIENEAKQEGAKLEQLNDTISQKKKQLAELERKLTDTLNEINECETELDKDKSQVIELMNAEAQGRSKLQRSEERKSMAERRLSKLRQAAQDAALEQSRLKDKLNETKKQISLLNRQLEETQKKLVATEQRRRETGALKAKQQELLRKIREELTIAQSRHRSLVESQDAYIGYQRGVREILLALKMGKVDLKGICGSVAELIAVPAELETAVETALGGALQNIVTRTDIDAKNVIEYLKKNKLGRVTFLPLNTLRPAARTDIERRALTMPGVIGVAADLVQCHPQYQVVVEFLLGKVLIVQNIEQALQAAKASGQRLRLVTLEGEYIHPGGSLTGGTAAGQNRGLLKAKRELEEYGRKINELKKREKEALAREKEISERLQQTEGQLAEIRDRVVEYQVTLATKRQEAVQLEDAAKRYGQSSQENDYEITNLQQEIKDQDEYQLALARQVAKAEAERKLVEEKILAQQQKLNALKERRLNLEQKLTAARVDLAGSEQQKAGTVSLINRLQGEKNNFLTQIKNFEQDLINIRQKEEELKQQITDKTCELERLEKLLHQSLLRMQEVKKERFFIQKRRDELRLAVKQAEEELQKQLQKMHALQLQQARLETEYQGLINRLKQEYGITSPEEINLPPVTNVKQCKERINELNGLLAEIGTVNPGAEEEYNQVLNRCNYLQKQKQDLDEGRKSLLNLISELDARMSKDFMSAFKKIQKEFTNVFKELFGGGSAVIRMVGDNPLTAGIEIEACPPGKKLQNINLLSGGERSLTAIALLFAILRVSPSPFCILDEIDAALDETNVNRFARYLLKFSELTQFIVVSHRKGTMEHAQTLYGVTMGSSGVSQLFSIDLAKNDAAATN